MNVGRTRASLALLSLLVVGAWVGSAFAHGTSTKRAAGAVPGVSVPAVTVTAPLVGPVMTPPVGVSVPAVSATVPAVGATVPAVSATVPAVTVSAPVVGVGVTTPSVTVATPPVRVTTPAITSATPVASAVGAVTTVAAQATKIVAATVKSTVSATAKPVAAMASKPTSATPTATTAASPKQAVTSTSARAASTVAARTRAARARRLRLLRHRRHAVRARGTGRIRATTTPVFPTPSVTSTQTPASTSPVAATQTISGPGDGASLVLTTPPTTAAFAVELPFLPIVAAANSAPSRLLSAGPGGSSYRLDAVPFSAPLLTGGFNGTSRFVASLLPQLSLAAVVKLAATAPSASPEAVAGGHSSVAPAGGGRGIGIDTPIGRIAISGDGYQFGRWRYPLASVGGIVTTALLSLAALAAISALFGGVSAGAAILRRRRAEASSIPVGDPVSEPGIDEGWDL
jgi:hypothetical protein